MSVWFITGASRGLGREIASAALARGERVVATARDAEAAAAALGTSSDLLVLPLDVTDAAAAQTAVDAAVERFGRIDVLVNNAGYGLLGAVEETSDAEARALFDVNVFGLLNVTRAALPVLRAQRSGRVLNIGSIGGFTTDTGSGVYGSTKFAVEGISEALAADLDGLGVRVTVVEPGAFRTDFLGSVSLRHAARRLADYEATAGERRAMFAAADGAQPGDPARAAEAIVDLAHAENPPVRLQLGTDSVARVEAKLELVTRELSTWRQVAESTDYDPAPTV